MSQPRVAFLDIETSPNIVYTWHLFKNYVSPEQVVKPAAPISFAYKWLGERQIYFHSDYHDGHGGMIEVAYEILNEADVVVHYNGTSFDIPWLNGEFWLERRTPPSPYKQIDLLTTVRKQFNFPSNKLGYLAEQLGLEGKVKHSGLKLWIDCMANDPAAWKVMKRYNKRDVTLLEEMYETLRSWIPNHPNFALIGGNTTVVECPVCGSGARTKRGYAYTSVSSYPRYQCTDCGKFYRGTHRVDHVEMTGVTS